MALPAEMQPARQARSPTESLLDLEALARFSDLLVFARTTVEGYFAGRHKSPYFGSAAEFAEYREYVPGEDIANIDWRVYGRSRKLYVRRFEEETDMVVYLLVDTSKSMAFGTPSLAHKTRLAGRIAAALSYLMIAQGDKVSLGLFDDRLGEYLPPGGTRRHLYQLLSALENAKLHPHTDLGQALRECRALFRKRGQIVILSDFLDELGPIFDSLDFFLHRGFAVLLMQVLDPEELQLPDVELARFVDLESGETVQVAPDEIRARYQQLMTAGIAELRRRCHRRRVDHQLIQTDQPYIAAIEGYLGVRE